MRLTDRFYFAAHDDTTGRPRLHPRAVRYGLAAALLAELLYDGGITIERGHIKLIEPTTNDALSTIVLHQLRIEPLHTAVPVWLGFLAHDSPEQVARRLYREGAVRREPYRRVIRSGSRYVPLDMNLAAWSWLDLVMKLDRGAPLEPPDVALAGLVTATGLDGYVLAGVPAAARDRLRQLIDSATPPLRDLFAHTASAIAAGVLAYRS
ncbi:GPP34 family phosphoprotein [Micromonospora sp. NPDC049679]|uniref:GOLPH3/VPS74 family protein n=1 Tax=Micromonospora sp. NPDC049679 TaxID=3155920 RepID=UPI0033F11E04